MMRTITLLIAICMLTISHLGAQETEFTASAPNKVFLGEIFTVEYTLNSKGDSIRIKSFEGFRCINGPNISTLNSVEVIAGNMVQKFETSYKYKFKTTTKGKFTTPEASIVVDGKRYYSNTTSIEVIDTVGLQNTESTKNTTKKEVFLEFVLPKKEFYPQEAVTATIKLYSKHSIGRLTEFELPVFDDFIAYQSGDSLIESKKDTVNGLLLNSFVLSKVLLYPKKSGILKINGGKLSCIVLKPSLKEESKSDDPFAAFFEKSYTEIENSLVIAPQTITVKPLPNPEPTDFSHICGSNIKLMASIDRTTIDANTPLFYQITLSGYGNIKLVSPPKLSLSEELKEIASSVTSNVTNRTDGTTGSITFNYTIISTKEGHYTIPAYSISYFDLNVKQYKRVSTQPLQLIIKKGSEKTFSIKQTDKTQTEGSINEVIVVMDISSTMLAQDLKPNRMEASIRAAKKFITKQKGKVGLVMFSEASRTICPLTSNLGAAADSLSKISTLQLGQGTAIGLGIGNAILELQKGTSKAKSIILLTDGVNNFGSITPYLAAKMAESFGIRLYLIGVAGKDSTALYPCKAADTTEMVNFPIVIDEKMLNKVANKTNGKYFRAIDSTSFDSIFREIGVQVNTPRINNKSSEMTKDETQRVLNVISQEFENSRETSLIK